MTLCLAHASRSATIAPVMLLIFFTPVLAQNDQTNGEAKETPQEEILVWGRAVDLVGAADSASEGIVGSIRLRHFGDAPLLEDNTAKKDATTLVNLGLSYPLGNWQIGVDVLNLFDTDANDIEYFYESRLFSEPVPVEDFHFHPVEPREFRLRLQYRF